MIPSILMTVAGTANFAAISAATAAHAPPVAAGFPTLSKKPGGTARRRENFLLGNLGQVNEVGATIPKAGQRPSSRERRWLGRTTARP